MTSEGLAPSPSTVPHRPGGGRGVVPRRTIAPVAVRPRAPGTVRTGAGGARGSADPLPPLRESARTGSLSLRPGRLDGVERRPGRSCRGRSSSSSPSRRSRRRRRRASGRRRRSGTSAWCHRAARPTACRSATRGSPGRARCSRRPSHRPGSPWPWRCSTRGWPGTPGTPCHLGAVAERGGELATTQDRRGRPRSTREVEREHVAVLGPRRCPRASWLRRRTPAGA